MFHELFTPRQAGDYNVPVATNNQTRYAGDASGRVVQVAPDAAPPLATVRPRYGDVLDDSRTGKPAPQGPSVPGANDGRGVETRPLNAQHIERFMLEGRVQPQGQTRAIAPKFVAKGFVNPFALARGEGVRGLPVTSEDLAIQP